MAHTINSNAFSTYSANIIERKITNHDVVHVYDWLEGASQPIYMRNDNRFKDIELILLITETSDANAERKINLLVEQLKNCTIKFDDIAKYYACHFEGKIEQERINYGIFKLTIVLACYKTYGTEVSVVADATLIKVITNSGTLPSEAYITITPTANLASYTILGLSIEPIELLNLTKDIPHIIDGYTYRYLAGGASDISNYNSFEFPILPAGSSIITFSSASASVTIKYFPKYN